MRKWVTIVFVILLAVFVGGVVLIVPRSWSEEPVYRGKPLGFWLAQEDAGVEIDAVRAVGTNAIPFLLKRLRANDSSLKLGLIKLANKQRYIQFPYVPASELNKEGMDGFHFLGRSASNTVPELIRIFQANISPSSMTNTCRALAYIGPDAKAAVFPLLVRAQDADVDLRTDIYWTLGCIHEKPEVVVPVLITALSDTNTWHRMMAASSLGCYKSAANSAIPALTVALEDQDQNVRNYAATAIARINSEPDAKTSLWFH
jgi:HEAT repeat protein